MRRTNTLRRSRARGTTLVETAMVLSVLLLFLMAIFEYGRYLLVTQMLANAARDGARYASTNVDKSAAFVTTNEGGRTNITAYVRGECRLVDRMVEGFDISVFSCDNTAMYANPPVIQPKSPAVDWNKTTFTERIGVRITANYRPILPVVWLPMGNGGTGFHVNLFNTGNTVPITIVAATGSEG